MTARTALLFLWFVLRVADRPAAAQTADLPAADEIANAPSFAPETRVVATHYFYWYKWPDEHFFADPTTRQHDILRHHFPSAENVSYESSAWHRKQMEDVLAAGIDVVLPVYWGAPDNPDKPDLRFSQAGLPRLTQALDEIVASGRTPPRVGLFYDTTTLLAAHAFREPRRENVDLRTEPGKDVFYRTIRNFFASVPPRHWACLDGRPIVALYDSSFAAGHDASTIEYVTERFQRDFAGRRPFVIAGPSWTFAADARTGWGAALDGPILGEHAAQVGAGYDDSPVPGRDSPTRDRLGGAYYAASWMLAIRRQPRIVIVETWNELHEGTPVCQTLEDGRRYIELTRRFAERFKSGQASSADDWADVLQSILNARHSNRAGRAFAGRMLLAARVDPPGHLIEEGLRLVRDVPDGASELTTLDDVACIRTRPGVGDARYLYFDVADPYYFDHSGDVTLRLTYLDDGFGDIRVQYDSSEPIGPLQGAYRDGARIPRTDSGTWKTASVTLHQARCANRQNGGADLRLESLKGELALALIQLTKLPAKAIQARPGSNEPK